MAAYCRVSTDQAEQLSSYEAQVSYYTRFIESHPEYDLAGIYADEGISATSTKRREQFLKMIDDCKAGSIDMIITKSISRFARNTLDCLNYVRQLKELGVGILFEKENINTLDAKGEVLLSILSSLAQDESRSISENSTWGIRRRFEQGKVTVNHKKFLGYDKDGEGSLIINREQAKIVRRIYRDYLNGKGFKRIAKELEMGKVPKWDGAYKWYESNIKQILSNEKYKGDALLQKTYTVDFLSKKRAVNDGQVPQYYVEGSHPAIIDLDTWEAVQQEMERRKKHMDSHHVKQLDFVADNLPFVGRVVCGKCGKAYGKKNWYRNAYGDTRPVWQCKGRYPEKGVVGCTHPHIDHQLLYDGFVFAYNRMVVDRDRLAVKWNEMQQSKHAWTKMTGRRFQEHFYMAKALESSDPDLLFMLLEKVTVQDKCTLGYEFLDKTRIMYQIE
ncbi:MAG: recombinase family protein [Bacillota bacterium]|nr:recombinase family protein [Bacillota bacterium]